MLSSANGKRNAQGRGHRRLADWLALAASPTFALMAAFAASESPAIPLCSEASGPLSIGGMAWMYLLMCVFHMSPWLNRIPVRQGAAPDTPSAIEGA